MATIYRNRQLVYLAVILFFLFSVIGSLTPFLTLHMRHLGFQLPEITVINTVSAFLSLLGPVLGGTLAERKAKYKTVTVTCMLLAALSYTALTFIPRFEKRHYRPLVDFSCDSGIRIERCVSWDSCRDALDSFDNISSVQLSGCSYQCPMSSPINASVPLHICFYGEDGNVCVIYEPDGANTTETIFDTQLHKWSYDDYPEEDILELNTTMELQEGDFEDDLGENVESMVTGDDDSKSQVTVCKYHPSYPIGFNKKKFHGIGCRPTLEDCSVHCRISFSKEGSSVLPNLCEESTGDPSSTFWSYLALRCIGDLCLFTVLCLLDALTVASTNDYEGAYGRIHVWPALAMAVFSPLCGALVDHYTDMDGRADYSPPAFVGAALAVLTCALIIALPVNSKRSFPQFQSLSHPTQVTFFTGEMLALLFIALVLGTQWGVLCTFLPWFTHEVGCSGTLTGLALTMAFGFSLPFLLISKNMVRNIGRGNLLVFALLFYGTRCAGVSYVFSPWWILPFATMDAFTLCVMWVSVVAYGQSIAPFGYHLVIQYAMNLLHFGVGRGIGSIIGGVVMNSHGVRPVLRGIAICSTVIGFLYLALYHLVIKKNRSPRKGHFPVLLNGYWHPLRERSSNGDAKAHQPIVVDQDDENEVPSNSTKTPPK